MKSTITIQTVRGQPGARKGRFRRALKRVLIRLVIALIVLGADRIMAYVIPPMSPPPVGYPPPITPGHQVAPIS